MSSTVEEKRFKSRNVKSIPLRDELIKLARERGIAWSIINRKNKEELAKILDIELVYNPDWRPPPPPPPCQGRIIICLGYLQMKRKIIVAHVSSTARVSVSERP